MVDGSESTAGAALPSPTPSEDQQHPARRKILIGVAMATAVFFWAVAIVLVFVVLNGVGSTQQDVDIPSIERDLERQIDLKVGEMVGERVTGTRVVCPSDVDWVVGESFRCDVKVPDSEPGYAEVTITSADGKYTWFTSNQ